MKLQFLPGNSNWSPAQLWLISQYIKYCVFKLNLENKLLFAPESAKPGQGSTVAQPARINPPAQRAGQDTDTA